MNMNKKKMFIGGGIILGVIILIGCGYFLYKDYQIKHAVVIVDLKSDMNVEFLSEVKVSDFITNINGKIIDDYTIDTKEIGSKKIEFKYINDDKIKIPYSYEINVVDKTAPVVWLSGSYTLTQGSTIDPVDKILCGDNYDNKPKCEIIGDYDVNTIGVYPLTFKATDSSGNVTEKNFKMNIVAPSKGGGSSNNNSSKVTTSFADVIASYKSANTEIGIDISHWQGDVDFEKLKSAGVEFVFIRVGTAKGIEGEYVLDKKYEQNIKRANDAGIPVGIYFYSYANSRENAIKDAKWVLEQIKGKKVDLPIAFDWENWASYNEFNLSFFGLTDMANGFLDVFKDEGYEGLIYSSKTYLENIWLKMDYPIWLAHYVKNTTYKGDYAFWQICSNGRVDGINGDVDIDIRFKR